MRIHHTVTIATPRARAWETIQQPPSSLLWLARPSEALEALTARDFASGAKHEFVERAGSHRHHWIVTVLLRQPSHGIDVAFDRGDLRLIVRQRLRAIRSRSTEWTCRFEAYPARASAYPPALYLWSVAPHRMRRRMRRVRADLERTDDRALAPTGANPAVKPSESPTRGTMRIGPGFGEGA